MRGSRQVGARHHLTCAAVTAAWWTLACQHASFACRGMICCSQWDLTACCKLAGLAPELVMFDGDGMAAGAVHNLLRPETVEALFVLWRCTGDPLYRRQGWAIFQAFEKHCKVARCSLQGTVTLLFIVDDTPPSQAHLVG